MSLSPYEELYGYGLKLASEGKSEDDSLLEEFFRGEGRSVNSLRNGDKLTIYKAIADKELYDHLNKRDILYLLPDSLNIRECDIDSVELDAGFFTRLLSLMAIYDVNAEEAQVAMRSFQAITLLKLLEDSLIFAVNFGFELVSEILRLKLDAKKEH